MEQGDASPAETENGDRRLKDAGPIANYGFRQVWCGQWRDSKRADAKATLPGSSTLIICDSFGTTFEWVSSTAYERVETRCDIYENRNAAGNLRKTLEVGV